MFVVLKSKSSSKKIIPKIQIKFAQKNSLKYLVPKYGISNFMLGPTAITITAYHSYIIMFIIIRLTLLPYPII